jgi:NADH-quinone oxidoreductase subunit H
MEYAIKALVVVAVFFGVLNVVPFLVFFERKIAARIQDRVGPNRVGLLGPDSIAEAFGLKLRATRLLGGWLQPVADVIKLIGKEMFIPAGADRFLYQLAPMLAVIPPLLAFVVIPVGPDLSLGGVNVKLQAADLNVGLLFILAAASLSAYGIAFGGWASNSKFSQLGGVRALAQMISYEAGLGLVLLAVVMLYNTVSLRDMVYQQAGARLVDGAWVGGSSGILSWGIWRQPLAFILFVVCAFAENNRLPFDLAECDAELVGGYHTEYSSMCFGMFFQAEYIAMIAMGALGATLFFGGWHFPGYGALADPQAPAWVHVLVVLLGILSFSVKTAAYLFFAMWVRWTLPRFRWDQLMSLGWRTVVPLALANLVLTGFLVLPLGNMQAAERGGPRDGEIGRVRRTSASKKTAPAIPTPPAKTPVTTPAVPAPPVPAPAVPAPAVPAPAVPAPAVPAPAVPAPAVPAPPAPAPVPPAKTPAPPVPEKK